MRFRRGSLYKYNRIICGIFESLEQFYISIMMMATKIYPCDEFVYNYVNVYISTQKWVHVRWVKIRELL